MLGLLVMPITILKESALRYALQCLQSLTSETAFFP
jgi:hypothetical protein